MRKLTCVAVAAVLLSQAFVCEAKLTVPTIDDLPVLSLQNAQKTACSRTANYFLRAHYKPVELNKDFADDIIDQYLSFLDYNKSLYTKDEVSKIYKNSDKILCSSISFIENIKGRGVPEDKLVFWPQFCEDPDVTSLERPKRLTEDTFNIVFAGNIGQAQGLDMLVETADRVRDENVRWFIVGDGRYSQALKEKVSDLGLDDKIIFTGWLSEEDANAFCERAKKYELLLVPGDDFGAPGYVRIAYCVTTDQIRRSLPAFRALAEEYGR